MTTDLATDTNSANNTKSLTVYSNEPISAYPYNENFNTNNDGWIAHSTDANRMFALDTLPYLGGSQGNGKDWYLNVLTITGEVTYGLKVLFSTCQH